MRAQRRAGLAAGRGHTWRAGERVQVRGRLSETPWQHLMTGVPGKGSAYFDLDEDDHPQTVIYVRERPRCPGLVEVRGTVLEARGASKRPGGRESKADEAYSELQIDVDTARCVD